jgi:hypothetical protein
VAAGKETSIEINDDKTMYMVMARGKNVGRSHNIKTNKSSFESVEEIRHFATKLTNQNSISGRNKKQIEVRECLLSFGATLLCLPFCYPKNLKSGIYKALILPVVLYGCKTWFLTLMSMRLGR